MAQEKARPTRARAKKDEAKASAGPVDGAKPKPRRRRANQGPTADDVATRAYLLWERGEPGDELEHWLRAEQELAA